MLDEERLLALSHFDISSATRSHIAWLSLDELTNLLNNHTPLICNYVELYKLKRYSGMRYDTIKKVWSYSTFGFH